MMMMTEEEQDISIQQLDPLSVQIVPSSLRREEEEHIVLIHALSE
jgi:hypothetical protein